MADNVFQKALSVSGSGFDMLLGQVQQQIARIDRNKQVKQQFEMQGDGNLVLYKRNEDGSRNAVWLSKTGFQDWDAYAVFQDDGNLVIYSDDTPRKVLWASFTDQTGTDNYGKGIFFKKFQTMV